MEKVDELAKLIAELSDRDGGYATAIPGLFLSRLTTTTSPRHVLGGALFCVTAQGAKSVLLSEHRYVYDRNKYLLISADLPLVGQIVDATPQRPMLGISLELDFAAIGALMLESELPPLPRVASQQSIFVSELDADLLDATIRLVRLLKSPSQVAVMAPLVKREIFYRLLLGEQSGLLRRMATDNGQVRRIAAGIEWLRRNAMRTVPMSELAREVNMSPSTMHSWFKAVTNMSPLQFQKQLRLQEARRLLLSEVTDAATVSQRVGYDSPSQFSREYRRLFGAPPLQDIQRIRESEDGFHAPLLHAAQPGLSQS